AGAGVGIGDVSGHYQQGALRNPSAAPGQFANLLLGFALAEATGLFGLVVALIILFGSYRCPRVSDRNKPMPQLNPLDWAPQLIWLVITFGVLYLLMKWVALPKIGSVIEMRQGRIAGDLEAADKLRRETQEASAAYEQALAEAKARAHGIAQEARNRLKDEVAAERTTLERDLSAKSAEAEAQIHQAKVSALKEVNAVASDTAAEIVRR